MIIIEITSDTMIGRTKERKVLAFLEKSTIRESPVVEALIDCLVAHNSIRLGYMIAPSLLKEAIRDDLSR